MADKNIHKFNDYGSQFDYEESIATGDTYVGAHLYGNNNDIGEVHYNKRYYVIYTLDIQQEDLEEPMIITDSSFLNSTVFDLYVDGKNILHNTTGQYREGIAWQFETTGFHTVSFFFPVNNLSSNPINHNDRVVRVTISPYIKEFPYTVFKNDRIHHIVIPFGVENLFFNDIDINITDIESIVVDERNATFTSRDADGNECNAIFKKNQEGTPVELCRGCKNTIIPSTIQTISEGAFSGLYGLKKINISNNVTSIGEGVLSRCVDLEYITVESGSNYNDGNGKNVIMNGTTLIAACKNSTIPDITTGCARNALDSEMEYSGLTFPTNFVLPAYNQISNSHNLTVNSTKSRYLQGNNINLLFSTDGNRIICGCKEPDFNVISGHNVSVIFINNSFMSSKLLTKLDLNEKGINVSQIRRGAFNGCENLEYVHLNENYAMSDGEVQTTNIGGLAGGNTFLGCKSLSSFTFSQITVGQLTKLGVEYPLTAATSISTTGFCSGCTSLQEFKLEYFENLEMIGSYSFADCKSLSSMTIPQKVSSIDRGMLKNCQSLTSITVNENNTTFTDDGKNVIMSISAVTGYTEYSKNTKVELFPSNCIIAGCSTSSIPSMATSIANYAFYGATGLTNVDLSNITEIGICSFAVCKSLSSVTIPSGLTTIGELAFAGCTGLNEIHIQGNDTNIGYCAFNRTANNFKIYVPSDQVEHYKNKTNWSYYADKIFAEN